MNRLFTVKDFLAAKIVPWHVMLSGENIVGDVPIDYISVIELPVDDFIRENEIVLSTARGCENDAALMLELVSDVHRAKASALLLSVPSDSISLPPQVTEYLADNTFPVVLIPWRSRFADITEAVLGKIRHIEAAETDFYESAQKRLLSAYLDNSTANQSAQVLADIFGGDAAVFDTAGRMISVCKALAKIKPENLQACLKTRARIIDVRTNERLYGSVYLASENGNDINENMFVQYLCWVLALWFDKAWTIISAKQNARDDFVWKLTRDASCGHEELAGMAENLGFNIWDSYLCIVGKLNLRGSNRDKDVDKWTAANLGSLKEQILDTSNILHRQIMMTYQQKLMIIYLHCGLEEQPGYVADRFLDKLEKRLTSIFPKLFFAWGTSNSGGEPTNFRECFLDAKLALELCVNSPVPGGRFTFKNTVIFRALSLIAADESLKMRIDEIFSPLKEYDRQNDAGLMKTLKTYLSVRNVSEAARILHLHRQSLLYRLGKIEELSGMSFKKSDDSFLLELCVRLFTD